MDLKVLADGVMSLPNMTSLLRDYWFVLLIAAPFLFPGVVKGAVAAMKAGFSENWQLFLLASTGVALSVASGYTTWDGLRNFTQAPLLSVLIAFGIQGVMLIVAWLIGESFARGMHSAAGARSDEGERRGDAVVGMLLAILLSALVFYWVLTQFNAVSWVGQIGPRVDWDKLADVSLYFALAMLVVGVIAFNFRRGGDLSIPYVQSVRIIAKNAVLWVMFLAAMAASVFFSFDSHFNAIFPQEQRQRAAEIRAVNQVGRVVADIGAMTQKRQLEEADRLFQSDGLAGRHTKSSSKRWSDLAKKAPDRDPRADPARTRGSKEPTRRTRGQARQRRGRSGRPRHAQDATDRGAVTACRASGRKRRPRRRSRRPSSVTPRSVSTSSAPSRWPRKRASRAPARSDAASSIAPARPTRIASSANCRSRANAQVARDAADRHRQAAGH